MNDGPASYANDRFGFLRCSNPPELPGTMSGLLEAAIADARKLDPDTYHPDFERWHSPDQGRHLRNLPRRQPDRRNLQCVARQERAPRIVLRRRNAQAQLPRLHAPRRLECSPTNASTVHPSLPSASVMDSPFCRSPTSRTSTAGSDFRNHLDSLEQAIEPLRQIEADAEPV